MPDPWQCPACKTWMAPGVAEHRCDPDGGVLAAVGAPAPTQPPATVTVTRAPHTYWGASTTTTSGGLSVTASIDGRQLYEVVQREHRKRGGLRAV